MLRQQIGQTVDLTLLRPFADDAGDLTARGTDQGEVEQQEHALTLAKAYERYMSDPTQAWTPSTRRAYDMTRRLVVAVFGAEKAITSISRADARDLVEVLRQLPRNAAKLFPRLGPRAAVERAARRDDVPRISTANVNAYLGNFSTFMNWAVTEEIIGRNPVRGLRLPDEVARRDKRHPFSADQLALIFRAPLFTGCLDGDRRYAVAGSQRPQNARYWVPLIALHSGMRLNEICQLDVTDIRVIDDVTCICVSMTSLVGTTDKRLKTGASDRVIPLHPTLLNLGLAAYAEEKRRAGETKLFDEIEGGPTGIRAVAFSKWFTQFLETAGARRDRTSFHSFRHNFRDELRAARIDYEVAMALGGWVGRSSSFATVSEAYGRGHRIDVLREAIERLRFADVDLSHLRR